MPVSDQVLCQLIERSAAQSVLLLGQRAAVAADGLRRVTDVSVTCRDSLALSPDPEGHQASGFPPRNLAGFDFVYLTDVSSDTGALPPDIGRAQYLSLLRSHCQGELLFEFTGRSGLATDNEFSALGFNRAWVSAESGGRLAVYRYSLHSYKSAPDWLNNKHWANPERWDLD